MIDGRGIGGARAVVREERLECRAPPGSSRPATAKADGDCDHAIAPVAACRPAGGCEDGGAPVRALGEPELLGPGTRVRGLGCLLEHVVHQARAHGEMPVDLLPVTWRATALPGAVTVASRCSKLSGVVYVLALRRFRVSVRSARRFVWVVV
ncbi:hypothetical protein J3S85_37405 [Streptomyces lavenduligriseus]|nr:hypothetical protein J3S85_37405 [Streptomyces lavenduligriseus]